MVNNASPIIGYIRDALLSVGIPEYNLYSDTVNGKLELATGLPILYRLNADTSVAEKVEMTG